AELVGRDDDVEPAVAVHVRERDAVRASGFRPYVVPGEVETVAGVQIKSRDRVQIRDDDVEVAVTVDVADRDAARVPGVARQISARQEIAGSIVQIDTVRPRRAFDE